jgi:hypothetical protein
MINSLIDQKLKRTAKESAMRAGAIVMQNNQVALIKRRREDESVRWWSSRDFGIQNNISIVRLLQAVISVPAQGRRL